MFLSEPLTSWNLISHVLETRTFVMATSHWKQGLLCDKENYIKRVLENVIKRAFGEINNIFQDSFNIFLSQKSTNVRFFLSHN